MTKKSKLLVNLTVLVFALVVCSSTPAGTGTNNDPVLMVVTGEFKKAKMSEVLAVIYDAKNYVTLDLSPITGGKFNLEFLQKNSQEYIVSLKLPGATKSIADTDGTLYFDRFPNLKSVTLSGMALQFSFTYSYVCFITHKSIPHKELSQ